MSSAIESQGITLEIETGTAGAVSTVTATVGYPTICTKSTHGLSDGDIVVASAFAGADAALLNGNTYIVKNVTTNTFALDVDTTGKTLTAANGTLTPVEFTAIGEVVDFSGPGGQASVIDVSSLESTRREKLVGLPDEGQFTFNLNLVPADVGQLAAKASRDARTLKGYRLTLTDTGSTTLTWDAYCLAFSISGSVDNKVAASITLEITGEVTWA